MGRGCSSISASKEGWVNARKASVPFMAPLINQTQDETDERVALFNANVTMKDDRYYFFGEEIESRISELYKRRAGLKEQDVNEDNKIAREGGDRIHLVEFELMNAIARGEGNIDAIRAKYTAPQDFQLSQKMFNNLLALVKDQYKKILAIQERIKPGGKINFYLEKFAADNLKDVGGRTDIVAVFSNNTGVILDYKTTQRNNPIGYGVHGKEVVRSPLPFGDIRAYDVAMGEYRKLWENIIGVTKILQTRLLPIAVAYKVKPHDEITPGSRYLRQFDEVIAFQPSSDFMKPIPVGGERSRWEGINSLIEKQYNHIASLEEAWKKTPSEETKSRIKERIGRIEKSIIKSLVDEDIASLLNTMYELSRDVESRLDELDLNPDGTINPNALDINEVKLLRSEMEVYYDIIKYTNSYFTDLEKNDKDKYDSLISKIKDIEPHYNKIRIELINRHEQMVLEAVSDMHKDENGNLLPYSELSTPDLTFARISAIDNPIFQAAWKLIQDAQYETKQKFNALDEQVHKITDALFKWGKDNGYKNRIDIFKIIINEKTGNLFAKLDPKFYEKVDAALASKDDASVEFMKKNFRIKNEDKWDENYKFRHEAFKNSLMNDLNNLKASINPLTGSITTVRELKRQYDSRLKQWEDNHDLRKSDVAWVFEGNRIKYLQVSKEAINENLSDEYKSFQHIKPVVDYYDMWNTRMEEFANILGITRYHDLPYNFIPNIRKEMIEHLSMDNMNIFAAIKEFSDSFNVREEDVYISHVGADGISRKIPILFMNKFSTDGKVDNTKKSYDLSTSLKIFGHMAYNYEHMNSIEPKILGLRTLLGDPSPEQGGIQAKDRFGRKIVGKIQPYLTKEGRVTETYRLFEDITDYYLYGIKFKDSSMLPGIDTVHLLSKAKNFNSSIKLGFALIPALGAFGAGTLGSIFTGKKGIMYTSEHYNNATKYIFKEAEKYKGLSKYIDPENDSYLDRSIGKDTASWQKKWMRDRTLFGFLREADKRIMRNIMVAMSQNFGVKEDGGIIRLNRKSMTPEEREKYKSIWDLTETAADGTTTVKGLSKDGYIAFREAVKNTAGEIIGNMNPDDIGKMDTSLYVNQFMAFRSWMPEIIKERLGKLRWDSKTQSMKWGRFNVLKGEFSMELSENEKVDYHLMSKYMLDILIPKVTNLIYDVVLFGLAPSRMLKTQNLERAKAHFNKWLAQHPEARKDGTTFEDYLEIKEAQIKAVITEIRVISSILALAMFLGMKGDDGEPRYYSNWATRTMYKIFTKTGSELTFMWNPTEFERLLKNPFPVVSLISLFKNTVVNTFDETRDTVFGENSKQDKAPMWYYTSQWVPGMTQLTRFAEVFEQQKKTPYQVYSMNAR